MLVTVMHEHGEQERDDERGDEADRRARSTSSRAPRWLRAGRSFAHRHLPQRAGGVQDAHAGVVDPPDAGELVGLLPHDLDGLDGRRAPAPAIRIASSTIVITIAAATAITTTPSTMPSCHCVDLRHQRDHAVPNRKTAGAPSLCIRSSSSSSTRWVRLCGHVHSTQRDVAGSSRYTAGDGERRDSRRRGRPVEPHARRASPMSSADRRDRRSARSRRDAPLRRDVRLVGDALGRVLVEQDGEELLADVERVRKLARKARESGSPADHAALATYVRSLDGERSTAVLRAFGLYFQLANVAEAWHRVRSRRRYEREELHPARVARRGLRHASPRSGVDARRARAPRARRLARARDHGPSRPRPRGARCCRPSCSSAACSRRSTIPALSPPARATARGRGRGRDHGALAGRRGALAAAARGRRDPPRAVVLRDDAASTSRPTCSRPTASALPDARAPFRFGSWVGGDQDGNPEAGPHTVPEWLDRARRLALTRYRVEVRAARPRDRRLDAHGARVATRCCARSSTTRASWRRSRPRSATRTSTSPTAASSASSASASRTCSQRNGEPAYDDADALLVDLELMDASLRANRGARIADGALADLRRRVELFGFHVAKLDVRLHANQLAGAGRARARDVPRRARGARPARRARARHGHRLGHRRARRPAARARADAVATSGDDLSLVPLFETIADLRQCPGDGRRRCSTTSGSARSSSAAAGASR